jgi:hypothetical protein
MTTELPRLLRNREFFITLLNNICQGKTFPDILKCGIFENELPIHVDDRGRFSVRLTLFGPGEFTPVHDHNAWGVIGSPSEGLEVFKYQRKDDGSREGFAELRQSDHQVMAPGKTDYTLPLDDGIHKTGNSTRDTILMLSIYGRPIRRLYINGFDLKTCAVYPLYPQKLKRKMLAAKAIKTLAGTLP